MREGQQDSDGATRGLTESQRWSVLRVAGIAIAMTLTLPLYYTLLAFVPILAEFIPPFVVHVLMGLGLLVGFPATHIYAHLLERRAGEQQGAEARTYGVNDRWERRNL